MDLDTVVNVGQFCERLLVDPTFQFISAFFEQVAVGDMLSTKAHDKETRESIYARVTAHREYLSMLQQFVKNMQEATAQQPPDHTDIDDPSVHSIYENVD